MTNEYNGERQPNEVDPATDTTIDSTLGSYEIIAVLNGLIQICKDGQQGFTDAAEGVEASDLKSFFNDMSQQRAGFAGDLQTIVRELGGDPEFSGSVAGSIHRGWINIKAAVTGKDAAAILNEAERGEDSAKSAYQEAVGKSLPTNVFQVVQNQYVAVQEAHDRVKALRDPIAVKRKPLDYLVS